MAKQILDSKREMQITIRSRANKIIIVSSLHLQQIGMIHHQRDHMKHLLKPNLLNLGEPILIRKKNLLILALKSRLCNNQKKLQITRNLVNRGVFLLKKASRLNMKTIIAIPSVLKTLMIMNQHLQLARPNQYKIFFKSPFLFMQIQMRIVTFMNARKAVEENSTKQPYLNTLKFVKKCFNKNEKLLTRRHIEL